jgi:hypothetical protein
MNKKIIAWIIASIFLVSIAFAFQLQGNGYFIRGSMNDQPVNIIQGNGYIINTTPTKECINNTVEGYTVCITPPIAVSVLGGAPADYDGISLVACPPTSTTCNNYIDLLAFNGDFSKTACESAGYAWSPSITSDNKCCGDDSAGDIGAIGISTPGNYPTLCDNCKSGTDPYCPRGLSGFKWSEAATEKYNIFTVTQPKEYDMVSNGFNWYYCNATGNSETAGGDELEEFETFGTVESGFEISNGQMGCPGTYYEDGGYFETPYWPGHRIDCPMDDHDGDGCRNACDYNFLISYDRSGVNISISGNRPSYMGEPYSGISNCLDECSSQTVLAEDRVSGTRTQQLIIKKDCVNEKLGTCIGFSNLALTCKDITGEDNRICNPGQACINGTFAIVRSSRYDPTPINTCCYGTNAKCGEGDTGATCSSQGGKICVGSYRCDDVLIKSSEMSTTPVCCVGNCVLDETAILALKKEPRNRNFICYKENNRDLIAECCSEDTCQNVFKVKLFQTSSINREINTFLAGTSLHSIKSFDSIKGTLYLDYVQKYTDVTPDEPATIGTGVKSNISDFGNIEFDLAYTVPIQRIEVIERVGSALGGVLLNFPVLRYSTNGDIVNRWHHIKIPITEEMKNRKIGEIRIYTTMQGNIAVDNLRFTTEGTQSDSKNKYCTGKFGTWINDFDPAEPLRATSTGQQINYDLNIDIRSTPTINEALLQYKEACEAQLSFGWTGNQCCGDDNNCSSGTCDWPNESKEGDFEYYNDENAACWAGYAIIDDETVSEKTNIIWYNASLLYKTDRFLNCTETTHGSRALEGTEGTIPVEDKTYCTVSGTHYCSNNEYNSWLTNFTFDNGVQQSKSIGSWEYKTMKMKPNGDDMRDSSCCPADTCWNGKACVEGIAGIGEHHYFTERDYNSQGYAFTKDFDNTEGDDNHVCLLRDDGNASWNVLYLKQRWDYPEDTSMILSNDPTTCWEGTGVVNNSWYDITEDHLCMDGTWTTRTRYIAETLLNYAGTDISSDTDNGQITNYNIYCDNYKKVLNNYDRTDLSELLVDGDTTNFCVIQYSSYGKVNRTIFGAGLNKDITDRTLEGFMNELNISKADKDCKTPIEYKQTEPLGQFKACNLNKLWYNSKLNTIIFSEPEIASVEHRFFEGFFASPFRALFNAVAGIIVGKEEQNLKIVTEPKDYSRIYADRRYAYNQSKEIKGIIENTVVGNKYQEVMSVRYDGYIIGDVCTNLSIAYGLPEDIRCWQQGASIYATTNDTGIIDIYWNDLTTKTRTQVLYPAGFVIRGLAEFDGFGNLKLKGELLPPGCAVDLNREDAFVVNGGYNNNIIVAAIYLNGTNAGNMCINGQLNDKQSSISDGSNTAFVVYGWKGTNYNDPVASIDSSGNLYLKGNLIQNAEIV